MKFEEKNLVLKNNKRISFRSCNGDDAKTFLDFFIQVAGETENMARYPEEITISVEKEKEILDRIENSLIQGSIGAFDEGRMIANINFGCVAVRSKMKHRASFGITVMKEYWNLGLGSLMIQEMLELLEKQGYEQVELEVLETNVSAIHLYKKFGFLECGRMPHGIKLKNGEYVDLISMIKFLKEF